MAPIPEIGRDPNEEPRSARKCNPIRDLTDGMSQRNIGLIVTLEPKLVGVGNRDPAVNFSIDNPRPNLKVGTSINAWAELIWVNQNTSTDKKMTLKLKGCVLTIT